MSPLGDVSFGARCRACPTGTGDSAPGAVTRRNRANLPAAARAGAKGWSRVSLNHLPGPGAAPKGLCRVLSPL